MDIINNKVEEKELKPLSGGLMLILNLLILAGSIALFVSGIVLSVEAEESGSSGTVPGLMIIAGIVIFIISLVLFAGLKIINPNEAIVLTLFGRYYGTIKKNGYFFVNPFVSSICPKDMNNEGIGVRTDGETVNANINLGVKKKISLKTMTLVNGKQKVNDVLGNPIIIGSIVIWKVKDPTAAVFNVENYTEFLSTQCDSTIRNIARMYPYDLMEDDVVEKTLRGSSQEIADSMQNELQQRVESAGLEIIDVKITHLAYSEEIAAAMLQRQQAVAIIAARQKIVEGAVSMVKMAIDQLGEEDIVVLDEERKAAMVSNLLVVLCGNKDAQPIVNSGSIY